MYDRDMLNIPDSNRTNRNLITKHDGLIEQNMKDCTITCANQ